MKRTFYTRGFTRTLTRFVFIRAKKNPHFNRFCSKNSTSSSFSLSKFQTPFSSVVYVVKRTVHRRRVRPPMSVGYRRCTLESVRPFHSRPPAGRPAECRERARDGDRATPVTTAGRWTMCEGGRSGRAGTIQLVPRRPGPARPGPVRPWSLERWMRDGNEATTKRRHYTAAAAAEGSDATGPCVEECVCVCGHVNSVYQHCVLRGRHSDRQRKKIETYWDHLLPATISVINVNSFFLFQLSI